MISLGCGTWNVSAQNNLYNTDWNRQQRVAQEQFNEKTMPVPTTTMIYWQSITKTSLQTK